MTLKTDWLSIMLIMAGSGLAGPSLLASGPMFDPALDDPAREWCYAAQSTTVIGRPFAPAPVQITYDGAIYTEHAELAFFYGKPLKPVMARNKTFLEGWIPVVVYDWKDEGVDYHLRIFSADLPELGVANLVQFAELKMTNASSSPAEGLVAAAARGTAGHFRKRPVKEPVTPDTQFIMKDGCLSRNGRLVYTYPPDAENHSVPGVPYRGQYTARDYHLTDRAATGFSLCRRTLEPGETYTAVFKMPRVPVREQKHITAIQAADCRNELSETVQYWKDLLGRSEFQIPEKRVSDS